MGVVPDRIKNAVILAAEMAGMPIADETDLRYADIIRPIRVAGATTTVVRASNHDTRVIYPAGAVKILAAA